MSEETGNPQGIEERQSKERAILRTLRKALASIVRDTTPLPGRPQLLKPSTREEIRDLFGLIAAREAELAREAGIDVNERPYYADQPQKSGVVSLQPRPDRSGGRNDG